MSEAEYLDKHYTIKELTKLWHMSDARLRPEFENEPGIIAYGHKKMKKGRKRRYWSMRIPASVAARVYRRLTGRDYAA